MSRVKKKVSAFAVIEMILIILLVLVMAAMIAFNFLFKNKDTPVSVFGLNFYITKDVKMQPKIPKDTFIIAKKSEIPNIVENSVILCNVGDFTTLIRVKEIQQEADKTYYVVKFDTDDDTKTFRISEDAVISKAVRQDEVLGKVLNFATSTVGIIIAVVIPLMFIIAIQVARILGIRRLEEEAASLDDIDEFINSRNEESPAPVTFTEPKFIEDVTGKIPPVSRYAISEPPKDFKPEPKPDPKPEKVLSVDNSGRAEYARRQPSDNENANYPLFTYDRLSKNKEQEKEPAVVGAAKAVSRDELYLNKPTRIETETPVTDEFLDKYAPKPVVSKEILDDENSKSVVFTSHMSNIIPDNIAAVQEEMETPKAPKKSSFEESVKSYYEKVVVPEEAELPKPVVEETPTIPENAVRPKETLAPPKKKNSSKALAELMSIIDAEETKLKK
ncbi:MAG: hypothetical protein K2K44_12045 [Oscillospiraceae bacterium]|nr:hypothetical protein [Oscillospiraceae bacterium]